MNDSKMTRRTYLRTLALGAAAIGLGAAGCKSSGGGALNCTDAPGLSEMDAMLRKSLAYVDKSTIADKDCANCVQYVEAAPNTCGGCKLVKGPINPKGYCLSWAAKA